MRMLSRNVRAGAALLDVADPTWFVMMWHEIDVTYPSSCVLGQWSRRDDYDRGREMLAERTNTPDVKAMPHLYGFNAPTSDTPYPLDTDEQDAYELRCDRDYEILTRMWKVVVRARKAALVVAA